MLLFGFSWFSLRVDGQVIHIYGKPPLGDLLAKDHVHHHLEGSRGVGESEEHNRWFEEAFGGKESRFPFVTLLDTYVVVSPPYVELGEEGAAGEAINGLRYKGGDVTVLLRPLVDRSIILDWTELPVFLFDKEEIGGV